MEQTNKPSRGFGRRMTTGEWVRCILWSIVILLFTLWVGDFWPLIFWVLVVDLYWTKFIPWSWWKGLKNPLLRGIMSWVDAIVFAVVAVYFLQNFFFQNFQIPTTSLEKTMLAGDYLLVSKVEYGPRIPMTPLSLPFFQHTIAIGDKEFGPSYIERPQVSYRRMAGLHPLKRYDIVVFNYPSGDTVATKHQNDDYYRLRFHNGVERMHSDRATFGDIVYRPVDRRENYVKRCVGMPGDTLQIIDNTVYIDGRALDDPQHLQHTYFIHTHGNPIQERTWRSLGVYMDDLSSVTHNASGVYDALGLQPDSVTGQYHPLYLAPLTQEMIAALRKLKNVAEIIPVPAEFFGKDYVYPLSELNTWTRADYGPIFIPRAGSTVRLTPENVALYERCIRNYEGNELTAQPDGTYLLNGAPADSYTFRMNYYWMMGDNRDNSADSRYWGFVPEDHIVGTPLFVWFSIDQETGQFRWDRLFKKVRGL
jgi:signal peptidase I